MATFPDPADAPAIRRDVYRIIPSRYPPIPLFEAIYDTAEELAVAFEIEALTNPRVLQEIGELDRVAPQERVTGPGSSIVMAPFTHLSGETLFSDGTFGVYYAALTLQTAIAETSYHRARFLAATDQPDQEIALRVHSGKVRCRLRDLSSEPFRPLLDPDDYTASQVFARRQRDGGANGLRYPSVRDAEGVCVAVFRPTCVAIPRQRMHLKYIYKRSTRMITHVYEAREL